MGEKMRKSKILSISVLTGLILLWNTSGVFAANLPQGISVGNMDVSGKSPDEAKSELDAYIQNSKNRNIELEINGKTVKTTYDELGYEAKNYDSATKTLEEYGDGNILKRYKDAVDLSVQPLSLDLQEGLSDEKMDAFIEENAKLIGKTAKNATIKREKGGFVITDSVDGVKLDEEATKKTLVTALGDTKDGTVTVKANVMIDKAEVSREDLEQIKDVLGTFTTDYASSSGARATNILVGAGKLNGKLLMPGETLSGYEHMHPFTKENGYETAHAYENGQVVDSVGGGACQIATTLYNAALRAEVGIKERKNHSMTVSYVQPSADAAIAGTYKDIKITNTTNYPIYVEAYTAGRKLTFTIWGKEERAGGRSLEFVSEVLTNTPAGVTYKDDPTMPAGKTVQEQSGHSGRTSKLWKVVKVNGVEKERILVSSDTYRVSNAIVRRGTAVVPTPETTSPSESAVDGLLPEIPTEAPSDSQVQESIIGPGAGLNQGNQGGVSDGPGE